MTILQATIAPQTIYFIPRKDVYNGVLLLDEFTGVETEITLIGSTQPISSGEYYHSITASFPMDENRFYVLKIFNDYELVHYDKIYCTNQEIDTYEINNGAYVAPTTDNEFVIYE